MQKATTDEVARGLIHVFSTTGSPSYLTSDRGSQMVSRVLNHVMRLLNIKRRVSASLAHRTNGLCERAIQTISAKLKVLCSSDRQISDATDIIAWAINHSPAAGTNISPFTWMPPRLFSESTPAQLDAPNLTPSEYVEKLTKRIKDLHANVLANIQETKAADKSSYDRRHHTKEPKFCVGDIVYLHDARP